MSRTYLICYSDRFNAKRDGLPLAGTAYDLDTMNDLITVQLQLDSRLILHMQGWEPWWAEYLHQEDAEECEDNHTVRRLPGGWRQMRWIEVYNGYGE